MFKKISVPGKIMLSGEYAVLFGERALAYTVDSYLDIYVEVSDDDLFHISSDIWKDSIVCKDLEELSEEWRQEPLIASLIYAKKRFKNSPLHIDIHSDLDSSAGMGSSSAVTLAAIAASHEMSSNKKSHDLSLHAYNVQKKLQGTASGYDILTQFHGGLVSMRMGKDTWPGVYEKHSVAEHAFQNYIHPFAGGKGSATGPLIQETLQRLESPSLRELFCSLSSRLTDAFLNFLKDASLKHLNSLIEINHEHRIFCSQFLRYPHGIVDNLQNLPGCDKHWTFKTTGAGGEDSLLLIGTEETLQDAIQCMKLQKWYPLNCAFTTNGLHIE